MTQLFSTNTFSCYSSLVEPSEGWTGISFKAAKQLIEENKDIAEIANSHLAVYCEFLELAGVSDEADIISFSFDENMIHEYTSAPAIRKLENQYVVQVGQESVDLAKLKESGKVSIGIDIFAVGEGSEKQEIAGFTFTIPSQQQQSSGFGAVERGFGLKVDPIKVEDKPQYAKLATAFRSSCVSPETMSLVAEFKTMSFTPQPKEMAIGDYEVLSIDENERSSNDGKTWKTFIFTFSNGKKMECNQNMKLVQSLKNPFTMIACKRQLQAGQPVWLRISDKEEKEQKDGKTKVFVKGGIFLKQPQALKAPKQTKAIEQKSTQLIPALPTLATTSNNAEVAKILDANEFEKLDNFDIPTVAAIPVTNGSGFSQTVPGF